MWGLLPIESMYLACLVVNTYAVRGRTKVLRGVSKLAAQPRSLEGTLLPDLLDFSRKDTVPAHFSPKTQR